MAAGVVAVAIAWVQWPRPPRLDGERWFKVMLATLLRGAVEQAGGDADAWEGEVKRLVPYHPAGRLPERKVSNPSAAVLPGAALPGELALIEALARIDEPRGRWARLYGDDVSLDALLDDPHVLGPDYDPEAVLGPGATWDTLAAWGAGEAGFRDVAARKLGARWVLVEGRPDKLAGPSVLDAVAAEVADAVRLPFDDGDLAARLREVLPTVADRIVVVAEEAGVARLLRALAEAGDVREQVLAVVSVGGVIGGRSDEEGTWGVQACEDWLGSRFAQRVLDTDVVRLTPYLALQWLDRGHWPPGVPGLALQAQRFPEPDEEGATAITLEVVDLGPLPVDVAVPVRQVARALIAVVAAWVASRR